MRSRPRRLPGGATEGGLLSGTASRPRSALRVLRRLAGSLAAVLLALLHPRVAGEEAGLAKGQAAFRIELEESTGEAVPDRAGLTRDPATLDLDDRVELALGSGDPERQADICLVDRVSEVLDERASVHDDLTLARPVPELKAGVVMGDTSVRRAVQAAGPDADGPIPRRSSVCEAAGCRADCGAACP